LKILAVDTSGDVCTVALNGDGKIESRQSAPGEQHSTVVLPMVHAVLDAAGLKVADLDAIAFGEGPGSFTGLRIACGVTQGLAFAAGLPVVGVNTLLAMAEAAGASRVVACLDARMQEIYHAAYERCEDGWREVSAPGLYPPAAAPALPGAGWQACGSGFAAYREALAGRYAGQLSAVDATIFPHAREIARIAQTRFERGEALDAALAVPLYLRDKVALKTSER
jgi:tRNA threonylcarbamoyladenosine biosynthesis protein TsaB